MDAYTKICQLCEGIKDRADSMENDGEVLKMTQEIIFHINQRKDEAEHEFNTLYLQIQQALSKGITMTGLSRRQILILYDLMNKELNKRQGYTQG